MKNSLKFQLDRMYRLMENKTPSNKKIISEQILSKVFELVEYFGKSKDEILNKIKGGGFKESERVAQSFENLLDKEIRMLSQEEYQFVSAIIRRLAPEVFQTFERNLEQIITSRNTVSNFFNNVKIKLADGTITPQDFVNYIRTTYQKEINIEAVILYVEKLKGVSDDIIPPESILKRIWESIKKTSTSILTIPGEFWNVLIYEIKNTRIPTLVSQFAQKMKTNYESYENTLKPLEEQMIAQYDMIMTKITTGKNYDFTTEINNINNLLENYRLLKVKGAKTFYDDFTNKLKKEDKFKELFTPESPFYIKKLFTTNGEIDFYIKLIDGYASSQKILPKIEITISKMEAAIKLAKGLYPFDKTQKLDLTRLLNLFLTWSPRSFEEASRNRDLMGTRKWVIKGVGQKIVFTVFVIGAWYAFVKVCLTYLLLAVNNNRIKDGKEPYKKVSFVTMEDFDLVNKQDSQWLAVPTMGLKMWMNGLSFLGSDASKVSFWSPAASLYPYLNKTVLFFLNPKRENLPVIVGSEENLQNEVNTSVADTIQKVNSDPKLKQYTDSMNLIIPTSDSIINKTNETISEIIK
jgi:hypothetical protein